MSLKVKWTAKPNYLGVPTGTILEVTPCYNQFTKLDDYDVTGQHLRALGIEDIADDDFVYFVDGGNVEIVKE